MLCYVMANKDKHMGQCLTSWALNPHIKSLATHVIVVIEPLSDKSNKYNRYKYKKRA